MNQQSTFDQLPPSWQECVREMRQECKMYRLRLRAGREKMRVLRVENAKMRRERNQARAELEALRVELAAAK